MRRLIAAAGILAAFSARALAGDPMTGPSNSAWRNATTSGGGASASSDNSLVGSAGENASGSATSSSYRLVPGAMALFSFPGAVSTLSAPSPGLSSATLHWTTVGYDGALGALQTGTSYYVRVASYTAPSTFSLDQAQVWLSTGPTGTSPGAAVANAATGLFANTTWFATVWVLDDDGNVSFASNRATFTALAVAPQTLPQTYLAVYDTSATLNWAALPSGVSSTTAEGYTLEASTTNFGALSPGGAIYSSATTSVAASTLSVQGLDLGSTYYFRVGSLNWQSRANYTALTPLDAELAVSSTGLSFGGINAQTTQSVVSASSIVVVNRGSLPLTLRLYGSTITVGSPWSLATSTDVEQVVIQAMFNSAQPSPDSFNAALLTSTQTAGGLGGLYAGDQAGAQVPPGQSRTLWFRFWRPTSTISTTQQVFQVEIRPTYP